jgi:DEAD/DEAH box helicase domain-containing protein
MSRHESLLKALEILKDDAVRNDSLRALKYLPPQEGKYEDYPEDVHPALVAALKQKGFERLYTHQAKSGSSAKEECRRHPRPREDPLACPSSTPS